MNIHNAGRGKVVKLQLVEYNTLLLFATFDYLTLGKLFRSIVTGIKEIPPVMEGIAERISATISNCSGIALNSM